MVRIGKLVLLVTLFAGSLAFFSSCSKEKSRTTGWEYNEPKNGGFEVTPFREQITGPGLVLIEGGAFVMGRTADSPVSEYNNIARKVTVPTFYMDQTEVSNVDYLEYLHWLSRVFGTNFPEVYRQALPDTLVWREVLAYNEPLTEQYLRHPAYRYYPVVGVSWLQASNYCAWRTDRVNEMLLIEEGILDFSPDQKDADNFNTEAYLAGQYEGIVNKPLPNLSPDGNEGRIVKQEDGILLPKYRLPTEAEWEYAALGLLGNTDVENITEQKKYPWNGSVVRTNEKKYYGSFMANFKRGRGDYMGIAGNLNDGADIPAEVGSYWPNDFGLYNMAGNVSEWVQDVYRPMSPEDVADYSPFRGNVFKVKVVDEEGMLAEKDSLGKIRYREVTPEESATRMNYRKANNINYGDGDYQSSISEGIDWNTTPEKYSTNKVYKYSENTLISDKSRVYKGGSWRDPAWYLSPSVRRFLEEDKSTNYIGFRCAMSRVGSPVPTN